MKKTIAIMLALLLALAIVGCAKDESRSFTHGIYEVAYKTEPTTTDDGQPAVKIVYPYCKQDGKKMKDGALSLVFGDGGMYGMYLKVDGIAYPITEVNINHLDGKAEAGSTVAVANLSDNSVAEVCYAGLERYVERNGNRFYYAPYRLAEPAEDGSAQLVIDFSYVNGMEQVKKDDFISGGCPNLLEPISRAMADQHFVVAVNDVEYEADSLNMQLMGTQNGNTQCARVRLLIKIPADTPLDAAVEVK